MDPKQKTDRINHRRMSKIARDMDTETKTKIDLTATAYVFVVRSGFYGIGATPKDAAANAAKAGAGRGHTGALHFFVGDKAPKFTGMYFEFNAGAKRYPVGQFTVGALLKSQLD